MPSIRLADADRELFGCPELLPIDLQSITNREAILLQDLGYPTPSLLIQALRMDGGVDYDAWTALVWLALRRAGVDTDPKTLEFNAAIQFLPDDQPKPPKTTPGKARARGASTSSPRKRSTGTGTSAAR